MTRSVIKIILSVLVSVIICVIQDDMNRSCIRCPFWETCIQKTVIFAPLLWLFINLPDAIRQHRVETRIRRGLCPACAYPVGDSAICTECGKPVIKQKAQKQKAGVT